MLGGGIFVTQNKTLPGSYINFVNTANATSNIADRGTVAIALSLNKAPGTVIEITKAQFLTDSTTLLGLAYNSAEALPLREIFCHANKVVIYDLGTDGTVDEAVAALEAREFNVLCAYTDTAEDVTKYVDAVKSWRDNIGKKCQVVVYSQSAPDHEGVINVVSSVSDADVDLYAAIAWVAGAEAGCKINESCTNMLYDGELTIAITQTQAELESCIKNGQITFHLVYGEVRMLEDVNSLTTIDADKGEDFKSNQTIRVIDQIANDIAKMFNTKYLGRIPNDKSGRISLLADVIKHHRQLEEIRAIEEFDATAVTVEQGSTKKAVVINDAIKVTNAMAQLYMTVVVQ